MKCYMLELLMKATVFQIRKCKSIEEVINSLALLIRFLNLLRHWLENSFNQILLSEWLGQNYLIITSDFQSKTTDISKVWINKRNNPLQSKKKKKNIPSKELLKDPTLSTSNKMDYSKNKKIPKMNWLQSIPICSTHLI